MTYMKNETWRLLELGSLDGYKIQSVYEAVGKYVSMGISPNTIILCNPLNPYVCIGYFQQINKEVNLEYCKANDLDILRRQTGGGTVYLDCNQQFYHIIAKEGSKNVSKDIRLFFERFLQPNVYTLKKFGLDGKFRPINDVCVGDRKISGNGAATIEKSIVLIGNIIVDMDIDKFLNVMKIPSEKFKDKIKKSMEEWLTSLNKELGYKPSHNLICKYFIEGCKKTLEIDVEKGNLFSKEEKELKKVITRLKSSNWKYYKSREHLNLLKKVDAKCKKISGNRMVCELDYKAEKLLRITMESKNNKIEDLVVSGDFFIEPKESVKLIESELIGTSLEKEKLEKKIMEVFNKYNIEATGVEPNDFVEALLKARKKI